MSTSANDTTLVNPDVEKESFSSTENAFVHALCTCSTGRQLTFQIKMAPRGRIIFTFTSLDGSFWGAGGGGGGCGGLGIAPRQPIRLFSHRDAPTRVKSPTNRR